MKISIIVEGKTEKVFLPSLRKFLTKKLNGTPPKLDAVPCGGRIYTGDKLKRTVENLLRGKKPADHVIALTDVYTGTEPPEFIDANEAKKKMLQWVPNEPRFHPHAAQFEFEAWLLPYWKTIQEMAKHNKTAPSGAPESINHGNPPSHRIQEIFELGRCRESYSKPRDAKAILDRNDLSIAIEKCGELKALVNTILKICGEDLIA